MEAGAERGQRFHIGAAILMCLAICAIPPTQIHGSEYNGSVGPFAGRARIELAGEKISGYLCIDRGTLSLAEDGYELNGTFSSGSIKGKISGKNAVGDLLAAIEEDDSQSMVKGTLAMGGRRLPLKLSRDKSKADQEPEILFRKEDVYSGLLKVSIAPSDYDRALEVLKSVPKAQIQAARADDQDSPFLYDAYVDECTRRLVKYITFTLEISPSNLEEAYHRLAASKLFRGLETVPMKMGQVFIPASELVGEKAPTSSVSDVAPSLLKEYFGRLLPGQSCRRSAGSSLVQTPAGTAEHFTPTSVKILSRDDFGSTKAIVNGKSETLFFKQSDGTERYELDLLLYPSKSRYPSSPDVEGYELRVEFSSGQLDKPAEGQASSSQTSVPISDEQLEQAAELMAACLEEFISGPCPADRSDGKYCDYVQRFISRGDQKLYSKDTEGAMADYAAALRYDPHSAVAYAARGEAYVQLKKWALAASDYSEAMKSDPEKVDYYEKHAQAVGALGDIAATISDYTQLIRLDPKTARYYREKARALFSKGDVDSAVADLTKAVQLDGDDVQAYFLRARALDRKTEYQSAIEDLSNVIRIELDQLKRADDYLRKQSKLGVKDEYSMRSRDRLVEGVSVAYLERASEYLKVSGYDKAGSDYSEYVKLNPNSAVGLFARGVVSFYLGAFTKALADLSKARELDPNQRYIGLWIMVATARANKAGSMGDRPAGVDTTPWPGPIYRMLVGDISSSELIRLAEDADPEKKKSQTCEATFFNGEQALVKGSATDAQRFFESAIGICPDDFNEWVGAKAELNHLSVRRR